MSTKYLLGIDEGTMSSRAAIFDLQGNVLGSAGAEYSVTSPKPGWYEQDCEAMAKVILDACAEAIKRAKIDPKDIAAVGLSSQGAAFVPVDKNNQVIRPCIGWQDTRGTLVFDEMAQKFTSEEYYQITGIPFCTTPWSISKILWLKKFEPETYEKTACFAAHQDYFLSALGVEGHFIDIATASRYGFHDIDNHVFSEKLLDVYGIEKAKLPKIVNGGECVGYVSKSVAERTGIPEGTPICVGAMDVNASILGLGVIEPGMAGTILGTYGTFIALSDKPIRDPAGSLVVMDNTPTRKWTIEGSCLAAASSYRWFRDTFGDLEKAAGKLLGTDPFDLINQQIATSKPGARGVVFVPHLASAGAPRNNPNSRGLFLGLTLAHNKADMARAVMEGISMEIRDMMIAQAKAGVQVHEARITGGGTKSPLWNQIQADVYNATVRTTQTSDTGALGAAMLAGVGSGIFKNVKESVDAMVKVATSYEPNPENVRIYNDIYEVYVAAYEGLDKNGAYDKVAALQTKLGL